MYTTPLSSVLSKVKDIKQHLYVDDTQVHISVLQPSNIPCRWMDVQKPLNPEFLLMVNKTNHQD